MNNASTNTLNNVKIKLRNLAKELLQVWNQRQNKTALQDMTVKAFGKIHDQLDPEQYCQKHSSYYKIWLNHYPLDKVKQLMQMLAMKAL